MFGNSLNLRLAGANYSVSFALEELQAVFLACTTQEWASLVQFISREISQAVSSLFFSTRNSKDPTRE